MHRRNHPDPTNPAAALGQRGGQARARNLTRERRSEISKIAALTRWGLQPGKERLEMIARLIITLDDVEPKVSRQLEVPLTVTLDQLHKVIQAAMGWEDAHLYAFWLGKPYRSSAYVTPDAPPETLCGDFQLACDITLANYLAALPKKTFGYTYDFGDDWHHSIRVSGLADREVNATYPRLLTASGCCPPEDIGGPGGYYHYLKKTRKHNPNLVDQTAIQERIQQLFPFGI